MSVINNLKVPSNSTSSLGNVPEVRRHRLRFMKNAAITLLILSVLLLLLGLSAAAFTGNSLYLTITALSFVPLIPALTLFIVRHQRMSKTLLEKPSLSPYSVESTSSFFKNHFIIHESVPRCSRITTKLGNLSVLCAEGSIEDSYMQLQPELISVVFNAANAQVHPGGQGTNLSLSKAVSKNAWKNTVPKDSGGKPRNLKVSEATIGKWIPSSDRLESLRIPRRKELKSDWFYLGQILGPQAAHYKGTPCQEAFDKVKSSYINALDRAIESKCRYIQLPLISSGSYAARGAAAEAWKAMVIQAFLAAVIEAEEKHKDFVKKGFFTICVINKGVKALAEYL